MVAVFATACGSAMGTSDAGAIDNGTPDASVDDAGFDAGFDAGMVTKDAGDFDGGYGDAIVAPAKVWTWVDFPESKCASGTPTGLGVNPTTESDDVLIYLEGGGACTNAVSCWGPNPGAFNLAGFNAKTFALVMKKPSELFNRNNADNPFRAVNQVFVPYCTGDMHSGGKEVDLQVDGGTKPTYFWGEKDLNLFLARLATTFPKAKRVYLAGASAGGFGTVLTFDQVQRAFRGARVDIIDDSGPSITPKGGGDSNGAFTIWGFASPPGCASCKSHREVLAFDRAAQPTSRYALMSYATDKIIAPDFGYSLAEFPDVLNTLVTSLQTDSNAAAYIVTGVEDHVVAGDTSADIVSSYMTWLKQMLSDDPTWKSKTVAHP